MKKTVLHVGCGNESLPFYLKHCDEVRLDIDPTTNPDIVGDMAHLPEGIGPFDAVLSCHSLEHLPPYDIDECLAGFLRVLKPGGVVIILVPDLEGLSPTEEVLYESPIGPVRACDLFYGYGPALRENPFMAHKCGFVTATMRSALERAGFANVEVKRISNDIIFLSLFATGVKP